MTPSEFEKKLKQRAAENDSFALSNYANGVDCGEWARRETLREVLEALRSNEGQSVLRNYCPNNTVRWLQNKLMGDQCKKESV